MGRCNRPGFGDSFQSAIGLPAMPNQGTTPPKVLDYATKTASEIGEVVAERVLVRAVKWILIVQIATEVLLLAIGIVSITRDPSLVEEALRLRRSKTPLSIRLSSFHVDPETHTLPNLCPWR